MSGLPCGRASRPWPPPPRTARSRWRAGSTAWRSGRSSTAAYFACLVTDATGEITALFYGRTHIPGVEPGSRIQLHGRVGIHETGTVMINPCTSSSA